MTGAAFRMRPDVGRSPLRDGRAGNPLHGIVAPSSPNPIINRDELDILLLVYTAKSFGRINAVDLDN